MKFHYVTLGLVAITQAYPLVSRDGEADSGYRGLVTGDDIDDPFERRSSDRGLVTGDDIDDPFERRSSYRGLVTGDDIDDPFERRSSDRGLVTGDDIDDPFERRSSYRGLVTGDDIDDPFERRSSDRGLVTGDDIDDPFETRSTDPPKARSSVLFPAAGDEETTGQVARSMALGEREEPEKRQEARRALWDAEDTVRLQARGPFDWIKSKLDRLFKGKDWKDKNMWIPKIFQKGDDDELEGFNSKNEKVDIEKLGADEDDIEKAKEQKPAQKNLWAQALSRGLGWLGWKKQEKKEDAAKEVKSSSDDSTLGVGVGGPLTDESVANPVKSATAKKSDDKFDFDGAYQTVQQWLSQMALTVEDSRLEKLQKYGKESNMKDWFHTLVIICQKAKTMFKSGGSQTSGTGTGSSGGTAAIGSGGSSLSNPLSIVSDQRPQKIG